MTEYLASARMMADTLRTLVLEESRINDDTVTIPLSTATTVYLHLERLAEMEGQPQPAWKGADRPGAST